jgi:ribosomal protein S18 acetylase RimI-like enzyme
MITIAPGVPADFENLNAFVAAAIKDAFYRPDLTPEEIAENDRIAAISERTAHETLNEPHRTIFVAKDDGRLAGFVIVDLRPGFGRQVDRQPALGRAVEHEDEKMPEIDWLIVAPEWQGKGVAQRLMEHALAWLGDGVPVQLGVIHFNERAIAFYKKLGFEDTGREHGRHLIPRRMMVRAGDL